MASAKNRESKRLLYFDKSNYQARFGKRKFLLLKIQLRFTLFKRQLFFAVQSVNDSGNESLPVVPDLQRN